jgi:hypothetical protein
VLEAVAAEEVVMVEVVLPFAAVVVILGGALSMVMLALLVLVLPTPLPQLLRHLPN